MGTSTSYTGGYNDDDHIATKKRVDQAVADADYVSKTGGDDMQGPLHVKGWGDDSRGTSRVKTLGVFSDSSSALRLGTTSDRVYIEDENTKFNGGIMVNNIGPKTEDGRGVTLNVEGSSDKHLVTKKYVDDAVQSGIEGIDLPDTDLTGYATEQYVDQKVYQASFTPGQQVAKVGSSSNNVGSFWVVDGALYCKVS